MREGVKVVEIFRESTGETKVIKGINVPGTSTINPIMNYSAIITKQNRYSTIKGGKQKIESENFFMVGDRADLREKDIVKIDSKQYRIVNIQKGKKMICELEL